MEHGYIIVAILSLLYALYVHKQNDRSEEALEVLTRALNSLADGKATIRRVGNNVRIEEVK